MRKAGLLMPVSALPSDYGVGDFGKGSREFIDIMKECGLHIWQILPLNPLGYGNSPYQPYSSFAGDGNLSGSGCIDGRRTFKQEAGSVS